MRITPLKKIIDASREYDSGVNYTLHYVSLLKHLERNKEGKVNVETENS